MRDPVMDGDEVVRLMQVFDGQGLDVVVDGGWGVDALLGKQTRQHNDLDIAAPHGTLPQLRATSIRRVLISGASFIPYSQE
jgi:lincosamide nucleotidyltransferase A/C/D/E